MVLILLVVWLLQFVRTAAQLPCQVISSTPGKNIRPLYLGFVPLWAEQGAVNHSRNTMPGMGLNFHYRPTQRTIIHAAYRTPFWKSVTQTAGEGAKDWFHARSYNTQRYHYAEAGIAIAFLDRVRDAGLAVVMRNSRFSIIPTYYRFIGQKRNMWMARGGAWYQRMGWGWGADSAFSTGGQRMDGVFQVNEGAGVAANQNILGAYVGLSLNSLWNVLVYIKGVGTVRHSAHRSVYVDLLYSPNVEATALAGRTGSPLQIGTGTAFDSRTLGFRLGYADNPTDKLDWNYGVEIGMRPTVFVKAAGRPIFVNLWVAIPVVGFFSED
jgi:hypothetical protein